MRKLGAVLICCVLSLAGCTNGTDTGDGGSDNVAGLACDHFRNISGDAAAGLLSDEELREKLKEVYGDSAGAGNRIRGAAQRMLSEATSGNLSSSAIYAMGDACDAAGH